ncbi:MAG TPA: DUF998 domain-containing protein [Phenylobacterium sp.]|nr:DUF998 domain-containing protein [Phenylobacterium sp.]
MPPRIAAGAVCWLLTAEFFLVQLAAGAAATGYRPLDDDISLLGVTSCAAFADPLSAGLLHLCSPLHGVMNAGFFALGLLTLAGVGLTLPLWRGVAGRLGAGAVAVASLGTVASGAWPVNVNAALHGVGALIYFFFAGIGIALLGVSQHRRAPLLAAASWGVGVGGLVAFFAYPHYAALFMPRGLLERVAGYPSTLWFVGTAVLILGGVLAAPESEP